MGKVWAGYLRFRSHKLEILKYFSPLRAINEKARNAGQSAPLFRRQGVYHHYVLRKHDLFRARWVSFFYVIMSAQLVRRYIDYLVLIVLIRDTLYRSWFGNGSPIQTRLSGETAIKKKKRKKVWYQHPNKKPPLQRQQWHLIPLPTKAGRWQIVWQGSRLCSRDRKICCYGDALSTIFLLAFVPCFLLFVFVFLFFSYFSPASRYVYLTSCPFVCATAICYSQQVRIFLVRVLFACVICTLPHLGIILFFIRLVFFS